MKISEKPVPNAEPGKLVIQKTWDPNPALKRMDAIRSTGNHKFGSEAYHVGSVPKWLLEQWCKEAGVSPQDNEAVSELLGRKLMSGDFSKLRNWQGRF